MCKANINLLDDNKEGSDEKSKNKKLLKVDSIRGKPRTDKLKVDIKKLERYRYQ